MIQSLRIDENKDQTPAMESVEDQKRAEVVARCAQFRNGGHKRCHTLMPEAVGRQNL